MRRLTDKEREQAARVWWIVAAAVERALRRNPGLRRHREELTSFAAEYLLRIVPAYRTDRGTTLESYVTGRARYLLADWMRAQFGREGQTPAKLARRVVSLTADYEPSGNEWGTRTVTLADTIPGRGPGAEAGAVRVENGERVRRLLARLSGRERRVVRAVALRERTQIEAAAELGMSQASVSVAYAGAIQRLGGETKYQRRTKTGGA